MSIRFELVSDRSAAQVSTGSQTASGPSTPAFIPQPRPSRGALNIARRWFNPVRRVMVDERGAVTAEYAIVIMAAVAFAGILVAIMRSDAIRAMLVQLVENALGTGG